MNEHDQPAETSGKLKKVIPEPEWTPSYWRVSQMATLSFRALGVHTYLMSLPEGWDISAERIARDRKEGRDAIRGALTELEKAGLYKRIKHRDAGGKMSTTTEIYAVPQPVVGPASENMVNTQVAPGTDNQPSVNQPSVNQAPKKRDSRRETLEKEDDQLPSSVDHQDDSQTSLFDDSFEEPTPSGAVAKRKGSNSVGKELARHRGDIEHLCEHLADGIEKLGLKRPKISKTWREEARLLLDSDEVPLETALGGISWALNDSFWKSKILSMAKYRKHYPQIYITAKEQKEKKPQRQGRKSTDEKIAEHLSLVERMAKLDAMGMAAV